MVALAEYLNTSYEPDCEWVDGELKERPVGEGSHATVQTFFIKYLGSRERMWGIRVTQELRTQVAVRNFRVPDVIVLRRTDPFEEIVTVAPLLCIEVLSPEDRAGNLQEKIDDYLKMGVEAIWVINPRLRKAFEVRDGGLFPVEELTVPGTEIRVTTAEVFEELNELQAQSGS